MFSAHFRVRGRSVGSDAAGSRVLSPPSGLPVAAGARSEGLLGSASPPA